MDTSEHTCLLHQVTEPTAEQHILCDKAEAVCAHHYVIAVSWGQSLTHVLKDEIFSPEMVRIFLAFVGKRQLMKIEPILRKHLWECPDLGQMFENAGSNNFNWLN